MDVFLLYILNTMIDCSLEPIEQIEGGGEKVGARLDREKALSFFTAEDFLRRSRDF
jgi:hypothetical protein